MLQEQLSNNINFKLYYLNYIPKQPAFDDTFQVKWQDYNLIYEGTINNADPETILDDIFYKFNIDHPKNFNNRSLSSGDIVEINNIYYLCLSVGWKKINISK